MSISQRLHFQCKRGLFVLVALVLCLLPLMPVFAEADNTNAMISKAKSGRELRAYASDEAKIVKLLPSGTRVNALWLQDGWYYVQAGDQKGFIIESVVIIDEAKREEQKASTPFLTAMVSTASGGNLNLRQSPSTSAKVVSSLSNGTKVTVYDQQNGWALISAGSKEGYVATRYLSFGSANPVVTKGVIANLKPTSCVRMRKQPSVTSTVVGLFSNGQQVEILGQSGNFYRVRAYGINGYISMSYVRTAVPVPAK